MRTGEQLTASGQQVDEDEMVIEEELWIETGLCPVIRLASHPELVASTDQALQQRAMLRAQLIASLRSECHARLHELRVPSCRD